MSDIEQINDDNSDWENEPEGESSKISNTSYSQVPVTAKTTRLSGMYKDWFLEYASYVILERAVPHLNDGLKPVQRRILHSMKRMDDGRYNKVANIIGFTMQYHPHGDASIGEALVQLGQKDLLIDTQGNWGNIYTGDSAAAPRYIEARLSKFANAVMFNPKTTQWKLSYDGRNKEPVTLPVKFPLLLAQGVEGIAVGLASKILPHNFNELIDASIAYLKKEDFELYPDFLTGGMADISRYNDGLRGGVVKIRARIKKVDSKTLVITDLPFGTTTEKLIESVLKANEKGKIKIKKIDDNTAENVEIVIYLVPGSSPDKTIDALYAFTGCEISVSPNVCVISNDRPRFIGVKEILKASADRTLALLKMELEIRLNELNEDWYFSSLEKIFIEKRIYRKIEECETWEAIIKTIYAGLKPYRKLLQRDITDEDVAKLVEIKIKRISKFNAFEADRHIKNVEEEMEEVKNHLQNLVLYTINYYKQIKKNFGAGKERKTELRNFENIQATKVVVANEKLYVNREEGFFGTGLKKDEYISDCSDIDDVIVFMRDGTYQVSKVTDKAFAGKNIVHIAVYLKGDERTIYNVIYKDGKYGPALMKRFAVKGITHDKLYNLTKGTENSKILWFTANKNGEAELVKVCLKPKPKLKKLIIEVDFSKLAIKGRNSFGNIVTKNDIHKIQLKEQGASTLGGIQVSFDEDVKRLNTDGRGKLLGEFIGNNKIITLMQSGCYKIYSYDLENHFEEDLIYIEKYNPNKIFTVIFFDGEQNFYYLKRFQAEENEKFNSFIGDNPESRLVTFNTYKYPCVKVRYGGKHKNRSPEKIIVEEFIGVKSYKAHGKRISTFEIAGFEWLQPLKEEEPEHENIPPTTSNVPEIVTSDKLNKKNTGHAHPKQMTLNL
ncbi:MAG: DNA topoisomerase IV [Bacteroidetes bacterium CG23_combo_of_CG06-09_8_20_14_all_32_9]|nr:MAG: DNA topoisomerase IV [Bacteroidetes bacterium CG23_combo_of_CG06-09_8_20_14_all_32_9]